MADLVRKKISNEEAAKLGLKVPDAGVSRKKISNEEFAAVPGEPGSPGVDQYQTPPMTAGGEALGTGTPRGSIGDALSAAADSAALGAGPQIAGGIGALARVAQESAEHPERLPEGVGDAYRDVRNSAAKELASSERTTFGQIGKPLGMLLTPLPAKAPGASRMGYGAKVGGAVGAASSLAAAPEDFTQGSTRDISRAVGRALVSGGLGAGGGALMSAGTGAAVKPLRSTAEEQALRASGLQAGIKNSLKTDLGLQNMTEARQLGRRFLDEGLIPPVGSSEAVARRAEKLEGAAGNDIGAIMNQADVATMHTPPAPQRSGTVAGRPSNVTPPQPGFDYSAGANAARDMLANESATADLLSGEKAHALADAFERQGERTPGSFVGANKAKSDAWKSANFAADAKMSPQLYRKAVGSIRDDIERQVADALGPDDAASLRAANEKYGVAADALKLAENESQRRAGRKGITIGDLATIASGGTAGGFAGHPGLGVGGGLAASLALKAADKYGHSSASRFADFLAKRAAANPGASLGGRAGAALEPYLELLQEKEPK